MSFFQNGQSPYAYASAASNMVVKSQPTPGDVFVSRPLTDASLAYFQDESAFIADRMFPGLPSPLQAGTIWEWTRDFFLRNEMAARAPNAQSAGVGMKLNSISFAAILYALHHDIEEQRLANEMSPISSDQAATLLLTQQCLQFREIQMKSAAFSTGIWTGQTDQAGVAAAPAANQFVQWDQATSTPIKNVAAWQTAVKTNTGIRPNVLAMGRQVWDALKSNPDIIDRIKYGSSNGAPTLVTPNAVAALFELDEVLISDVAKETANEAATQAYSFVIGKELVLFYRPKVAAVNVPSAGYTINWSGYMGATSVGMRMKRFYIPEIASWRVEAEQAFVQKVTSSALGAYASAVVA
jgi:hypothetical protein